MKSRKLFIGMFIFCIVMFGAIFLFFSRPHKPIGPFTFTNLSNCTKGIDRGIVDNLNTKMYSYIKQVNDYNEASTAPHYDGTIRAGSCSTKKANNNTLTTTAIVDIPAAKQSWGINFNWASGPGPQSDLGTLTPSCLPNNQLPYGDFGCSVILNIQRYGTDQYDPILQYTPYTSPDFNITFTSSSHEVDVTILVSAENINNTVLIENDKIAVGIWFTQHHLNISSYTVKYTVSQVE